ncbi:MAG: molybdopterin molybdotransferase MoeA [Pseudomonadota bacterium]
MVEVPGLYEIGFEQALNFALTGVSTLGPEFVPASELVGRVCARDVIALIDYPSADSSLKDGYAVVSQDVARAGRTNPVLLEVVGMLGAGDPCTLTVSSGTAVRVLSGATVPQGADAVLAEEFTEKGVPGRVTALGCAEPGRNILAEGSEVARGEILVQAGEMFTPGKVSLIVAGGIEGAYVFRRPIVGLLATGSEVLLPGRPPETGKLFASNLALQDAWLRSLSVTTIVRQAGDSFDTLTSTVESMLPECDILLTSGGAWKGDRDLIVKVLDGLGWDLVFHRVRLGPGKAVAMGFLRGKTIFCLPGGPPSNEAAFLLIALPAVFLSAGYEGSPFLRLAGTLTEDVGGQMDWTQVIHCTVERDGLSLRLTPIRSAKRLGSMAEADGLVLVPEGVEHIPAGTTVEFIRLNR